MSEPGADGGRDDALEWLAVQARDLEKRVADLIAAASHLGEERVAAARAAAEAIVNAALREAEEIRRAAAHPDVPPPGEGVAAAPSSPLAPAPTRARVFVGGDDVEAARRLAEELILGGLQRARIEAELAARFPSLGAERIDALIRALLVPPAPRGEAAG